MFKKLLIAIGALTLLWVLSTQFELKDKDTPRIINPTHPIQLPRVSVSKR